MPISGTLSLSSGRSSASSWTLLTSASAASASSSLADTLTAKPGVTGKVTRPRENPRPGVGAETLPKWRLTTLARSAATCAVSAPMPAGSFGNLPGCGADLNMTMTRTFPALCACATRPSADAAPTAFCASAAEACASAADEAPEATATTPRSPNKVQKRATLRATEWLSVMRRPPAALPQQSLGCRKLRPSPR